MDQAVAVGTEKANVRKPRLGPRLKLADRFEVVAVDDRLDAPLLFRVKPAGLACERSSSTENLTALTANKLRITLASAMGNDSDASLDRLIAVDLAAAAV